MFPGLADASRRPGSGVFAPQLLALLMLLAGCKINASDVDTWKGTVKGPGKIVAVLLADKYDLSLRSHAALALLDLDRRDVDGLQELLGAIQRLEPAMRERIVGMLVPRLTQTLRTAGPSPAPTNSAVSPAQVRAKDAAFALQPFANAEHRKRLTDAVLRWYAADFDARSLAGNYSGEQVVRALGASAATMLVDALDAGMPPASLVKLAELIGQLGNDETRARAGQKLLAIEAEMRGDRFYQALKTQIAAQLGAPAKGAQAADKINDRVEKAAKLNRDRFIDEGALPALSHLGNQPAVGERLLSIAADRHASTERRTRALQALEGKVGEAQLAPLLALALDPGAPVAVQDYAFDRVGDTRSPKAIPALWPLLQSTQNPKLRGRAGELILAIGGPSMLGEFFGKLPGGPDASYEPDELEGYAARMGQMTPLPVTIAGTQLTSKQWWARVIALNFFARKGAEKDIDSINPLLGDGTAVQGKNWEPNTTVGRLAKQAIESLAERVRQPQG